jgi:hypothetical protein
VPRQEQARPPPIPTLAEHRYLPSGLLILTYKYHSHNERLECPITRLEVCL